MKRAFVVALALWSATGCGAQPAQQASQSPAHAGNQTPAQVAMAPCDNTYMPVKAGVKWTYSNTSSAGKLTQVSTITDVGQDTFTMSVQPGGAVSWTETWTCTPDGLLQLQNNAGIFSAVAAGPSGKANVKVLKNTGITVPRSAKPGDTWTQQTDEVISGSKASLNVKVTANFHASGAEAVTVPAGTFDAMRVDATFSDLVTVGGNAMPFTIALQTWWVAGKGMVKSISTFQQASSTIELQSVQIP